MQTSLPELPFMNYRKVELCPNATHSSDCCRFEKPVGRQMHGYGIPMRVAGMGTNGSGYGYRFTYPPPTKRVQEHIFWWRTDWDMANFVKIICYISFSLSSFYWLSWHSNSAPNVYFHFVLIILPHVTLSAFILISGFKCFSIVPNFYMHSRLPFHMLSLFFPCALTLFTTFSELLWHFIFLWLTLITLPTYPDAVYKLMYFLSSSSVCKLTLIHLLSYLLSKSPLSSQVSLSSLIALLILW